ncbi:MAG TPA: FtsW/RodA/SpoVE family cell cycle protein [Acidimicrobiales bacterium]|nr:FtsW/RodA/SpoVE family cell cycle protein [Acidimicrobiales bacterium]
MPSGADTGPGIERSAPVAGVRVQNRPPTTRGRRRAPLPRYAFGPKPKRRTEFVLLLFGSGIVVALYIITSLGQNSKIPPDLSPFLGIVLGLALAAHMANRWLVPDSNAVVLPVAALLNGIGYVVIARWNHVHPYIGEARNQALWTAIGVGAYVLTLLIVRHSRDLERYRYLLLLLGGLLLVLPLGFSPINGARLWVHLGSIRFQPVELSKILLCIFFASYFAENKELLTIPTAQIGNRLYLDPRPLLPILVAWGAAMAIIGLEDDIGFAALLFVLFIGMLWIATGRVGYLVLGLVLFGVGAFIAAHYFGQVHIRVDAWRNPWPTAANPNNNGYQLSQAWYSMGTGGVGGTGLGLDNFTGYIPELTSDMIFAAIGTEMGLVGAIAVVLAFVLLVGAGFRIAQAARSDFSRLMATGLTLIVGFQAFFIMAGVVRLLPFTGVTLPFVAYGGSSLVSNYILIALLLRISDEGAKAQREMLAAGAAGGPGERPMVPAG